MLSFVKKHPIATIFFIALYALALVMGHSVFGLSGLMYVALVPLPIIFLSFRVQKNKTQAQTNSSSSLGSIWQTPVPYLGIVLLGSIVVFVVSKF